MHLQETAFRVILQKWLDDLGSPPKPPGGLPSSPQLDTPLADVPQQFQTFMRANALSGEMVGKVFHPLGPGAQLVVSDLPGKGKAGKQISLALLIAVGQAICDGSFKCTLEELRNLCVHYNCYDGSNFAAVLRLSASGRVAPTHRRILVPCFVALEANVRAYAWPSATDREVMYSTIVRNDAKEHR